MAADPTVRTGLGYVQVELCKKHNTCSANAWAIVTGLPVEEVLAELQSYQASLITRSGTYFRSTYLFAKAHGYEFVDLSPKLLSGGKRSKHALLKAQHLPKGRVVAHVPGHALAVVDHVVHDSWDSRGLRSRRLECYFVKKA